MLQVIPLFHLFIILYFLIDLSPGLLGDYNINIIVLIKNQLRSTLLLDYYYNLALYSFGHKLINSFPCYYSSKINSNLFVSRNFSGIYNFLKVGQIEKSGGGNIGSITILYKPI